MPPERETRLGLGLGVASTPWGGDPGPREPGAGQVSTWQDGPEWCPTLWEWRWGEGAVCGRWECHHWLCRLLLRGA